MSQSVNATRIREVLEPFAALLDWDRLPGSEFDDDWRPFLTKSQYIEVPLTLGLLRAAHALLRDLDAQGAVPAGALHAPTVETCALVAEGFDAAVNSKAMGPFAHDPKLVSAVVRRDFAIADTILALTSGAEAGERKEASAEPNEALRSLYQRGKDIEQNGIAESRPLSEWSDEELFQALPKWEGTKQLNWHNSRGDEIRSRGWRPHHGSDKAPVDVNEEVEIWQKGLGYYKGPIFGSDRWQHKGRETDIIAYRPVPAKAESAPHTPPWVSFCPLREWRDEELYEFFKSHPSAHVLAELEKRGLPLPAPVKAEPAADAGEVERLRRDVKFWACIADKADKIARAWEERAKIAEAAALRPAPTEEQVERAIDKLVENYLHPMAHVRHFKRDVLAILAVGPAPQAEAGR